MDHLEAIKQLKARYFRTMDTKDWDAMRRIELTSATTAKGIWAMEDHLKWPNGGWRIKTLTLTRLRVDVSGPGNNDGRADP